MTRKVYADFVGPNEVGHYSVKENATLSALVGSIQDRHDTRVVTIKVLGKRVANSYARGRGLSGRGILNRANQFARAHSEYGDRNIWSITEDVACKSLKEHGQVVFKSTDIIGDAAILVSATRLQLDTNETYPTGGTMGNPKPLTPAQIKRAFVKHSVGASRNRVFVQTVIPFLA